MLLPIDTANKAIEFKQEFSDRNVGKFTVINGQIKELFHARRVKPIQDWLNQKVTSELLGANHVATD